VTIRVLGQSFEVLHTMDMILGGLPVLMITIRILGYNHRTAGTTITVLSSCPVFFQRYSRNNRSIGPLIPLEQLYTHISMQEELD